LLKDVYFENLRTRVERISFSQREKVKDE